MINASLTKDNIIKLIKNNGSCLTFLKPMSSSSHVSQIWFSFSSIYFNNYKQKFVAYDNCKEVLHHTSSNDISSMTKHKKICSKIVTNNDEHRSIKEYFAITTAQSIPRRIKEKITLACTDCVVLDNRSFQLICGDGFVNLAETMFSVDRNVQFCGIALHHLTSQLQLQNLILGCYLYDCENHSTLQVRQFVNSKLSEFHLKLDNEIFMVTDNENCMKTAFKESRSSIGCSIHCLNKQLEHTFMTKEIDKVKANCNIAQEMFSNIRKIVAHITRSHKQCK
ncbi:unnamed protein product [Rotaria sp. Silwood2]|nr:unnamed protein product [Rotaria sp. Silwood2]CAF4524966.1 unnamed protein product [Rotaria sp. Silwood2]CAF4590819.1 unnamed protein product [Rotaria sp. Silwood2]